MRGEGFTTELVELSGALPVDVSAAGEPTDACVLVLRNPLGLVEADDLIREQLRLTVDKKAFMKGRVVNKLARHNLCFSEVS